MHDYVITENEYEYCLQKAKEVRKEKWTEWKRLHKLGEIRYTQQDMANHIFGNQDCQHQISDFECYKGAMNVDILLGYIDYLQMPPLPELLAEYHKNNGFIQQCYEDFQKESDESKKIRDDWYKENYNLSEDTYMIQHSKIQKESIKPPVNHYKQTLPPVLSDILLSYYDKYTCTGDEAKYDIRLTQSFGYDITNGSCNSLILHDYLYNAYPYIIPTIQKQMFNLIIADNGSCYDTYAKNLQKAGYKVYELSCVYKKGYQKVDFFKNLHSDYDALQFINYYITFVIKHLVNKDNAYSCETEALKHLFMFLYYLYIECLPDKCKDVEFLFSILIKLQNYCYYQQKLEKIAKAEEEHIDIAQLDDWTKLEYTITEHDLMSKEKAEDIIKAVSDYPNCKRYLACFMNYSVEAKSKAVRHITSMMFTLWTDGICISENFDFHDLYKTSKTALFIRTCCFFKDGSGKYINNKILSAIYFQIFNCLKNAVYDDSSYPIANIMYDYGDYSKWYVSGLDTMIQSVIHAKVTNIITTQDYRLCMNTCQWQKPYKSEHFVNCFDYILDDRGAYFYQDTTQMDSLMWSDDYFDNQEYNRMVNENLLKKYLLFRYRGSSLLNRIKIKRTGIFDFESYQYKKLAVNMSKYMGKTAVPIIKCRNIEEQNVFFDVRIDN